MKLILFTTDGCHLCERALDEIELCVQDYHFVIQEVDIATDPELLRQYGTSIPVLYWADKQQALYWPFDRWQVLNFLKA